MTNFDLPLELRTRRLVLRRWLPSDLDPFAAMNADARVMEFFPATLSRTESDGLAARIEAHFDELGFGLWAVEIPGTVRFAGFIGLVTQRFEAPFTPCIEIGWRLAANYWGHGYATEGASTVLRFAFEEIGLNEVVSMTPVMNQRSRHVMEKIGMKHSPADDFDHPRVPPGHPLVRHVLYRSRREDAPLHES